MKPSKLKFQLETKHPEYSKKDLYFFKRCFKSQRLNATGLFQQQSAATIEASYEITYELAKQKSRTRWEKHFLNPA